MDLALRDLGDYVEAALPDAVVNVSIEREELVIDAKKEKIVRLLTFLRDDVNCQFKQLMDICGVDFLGREGRAERFDVIYNLLSLSHNRRIRIKVRTDAGHPVPTVTGVYSAANWWERETWDLFGIYFLDHPDPRRILSDYGFEGHALRKDFPLTGYVEVRYDDEQKRVVYEPVELQQEFRSFDFQSPWEGMPTQLPGDEKAEDQERP